MTDEEIRNKYYLPEDGRDWTVASARKSLELSGYEKRNVVEMHYRPFDIRWTYFINKSKGFIAYPRYETMKHFKRGSNFGLIFMRQVVLNAPYTHFLVTDLIVDLKLLRSSEGTNFISPLYLYQNDDNNKELFDKEFSRVANFTDEFQKFISKKYSFIPSPEQILGYMYAIFYSPSYRRRYEEFLKIDFPRVPFIDNEKKFMRLAEQGLELIEHHLMKQSYSLNLVSFPIEGSDIIEEIKFVAELTSPFGKAFINKQQYFDNIPTNVWEFEIGGYRVLQSWLKYRKSMTLSYEWQETFLKICNIIAFTISQMKKIDGVLK